mmetsp:Transcript_10352/g.42871  ORF Transcript_10352/g.42871 Transcript_10352/m.42871 type:complete len:267 (+) Transcript_10352:555-1355(+)
MAATPPRRHANSGAVKCFRSSRGTILSRPCRTASIAADFVTRSSLCLAWSLTYLSLLKSVTVFLEPPGTSSVSVRVVVAAVVVVATPPAFSSDVDVVRSTTSSLLALVAGRGRPSVFATATSTARVSQSVLLLRSTRYSDSSIVRTLSTCMLPDRQSEACAWSCWRTQCAIRFSIGLSDGFCSSRRHDHRISGSSLSLSSSSFNDSAGSVVSSSSTENVRQRFSTPPFMSRTVSKLLATSGAISSRSSHAVALPRIPLRNALEKDT